MPQIVVIGAGVIGLSSALWLQETGHDVAIVARDFPGPFETIDPEKQIDYTSPWGGAHNRFVLPTSEAETREHAMALRTFARMEALAEASPEAGVTFMKGLEYLERPPEVNATLTPEKAEGLGIQEFRLLGRDELPANVQWGCEYRTWCVNTMVYCAFLLRRFVFRGGRIMRREVRSPAEVFALAGLGSTRLVVNCSGSGFGDPHVYITRGQTCLVANACAATVTRQNADGSWSFAVPRNFEGGTVVGGTKEPDAWDPSPSPAVRAALLRSFAATYPAILGEAGRFTVLKDIVGRRPTRRGGMRLESERLDPERVVVHAYGLGGRGFELSWGVAEGVLQLVQEAGVGRGDKHETRL